MVKPKELDDKDYFENPTKLFKLIEECKWKDASQYCMDNKNDVSTWVVKRDADNGITWRRLPIHEACIRGTDVALLATLVEIFPKGVRSKDSQGKLPLHLASTHSCSKSAIDFLSSLYSEEMNEDDFPVAPSTSTSTEESNIHINDYILDNEIESAIENIDFSSSSELSSIHHIQSADEIDLKGKSDDAKYGPNNEYNPKEIFLDPTKKAIINPDRQDSYSVATRTYSYDEEHRSVQEDKTICNQSTMSISYKKETMASDHDTRKNMECPLKILEMQKVKILSTVHKEVEKPKERAHSYDEERLSTREDKTICNQAKRSTSPKKETTEFEYDSRKSPECPLKILEMQKLKELSSTYKEEIEKQKERYNELQEHHDMTKTMVTSLEKKNKECQNIIEKYKSSNTSLNQRLKDQMHMFMDLNEKYKAANERIDYLENKARNDEEVIGVLEDTEKLLQGKLDECQSCYNMLLDQNEAQVSNEENLEILLSEEMKKVESFVKSDEELRQKLTDQEKKHRSKLLDLAVENVKCKEEIDSLTKKNKLLTEKNESLNKDNQSLKEQVQMKNVLEAEMERLKSDMKDQESMNNAMTSKLTAQNKSLKKKLDHQIIVNHSLSAEKEVLHNEKDEVKLKQELEQITTKYAELREIFTLLVADISKLDDHESSFSNIFCNTLKVVDLNQKAKQHFNLDYLGEQLSPSCKINDNKCVDMNTKLTNIDDGDKAVHFDSNNSNVKIPICSEIRDDDGKPLT